MIPFACLKNMLHLKLPWAMFDDKCPKGVPCTCMFSLPALILEALLKGNIGQDAMFHTPSCPRFQVRATGEKPLNNGWVYVYVCVRTCMLQHCCQSCLEYVLHLTGGKPTNGWGHSSIKCQASHLKCLREGKRREPSNGMHLVWNASGQNHGNIQIKSWTPLVNSYECATTMPMGLQHRGQDFSSEAERDDAQNKTNNYHHEYYYYYTGQQPKCYKRFDGWF